MSNSSERGRSARRAARRLVDGARDRYRRAGAVHRAAARAELLARALPRRRRAAVEVQRVQSAPTIASAPMLRSVTCIDASLGTAAAIERAVASDAELLCFTRPTSEPRDAPWLAQLVGAVTGNVAAAAPQLVHPRRPLRYATPYDGRVRELGLAISVHDGVPLAVARGAGEAVALTAGATSVDAVSSACFVVERAAYLAAGGLSAATNIDVGNIDVGVLELCRHLRAMGRTIVVVPETVVFDDRPVASTRALREPFADDPQAWRLLVERIGPELMRDATGTPSDTRRIALTVAAPNAKVANRWGDWHLAQALAGALRRQGHEVRVQTADHADDLAGRACDVHCVLRGVATVARTPGQRHVLWIISHPEAVDDAECEAADLVLVASERFAADLASRISTPVEVMLQATDTRRFHRMPSDPRYAHDIVVVAKSRDIPRAAVIEAVAAGLRPAIYGSGWAKFVDPNLVVSEYVANDQLPLVYSSAGVVLSDHWDAMREWGFVSNRLFDALACGTPVISDDMPEIPQLFGDAVPMFTNADDLRALVDATLADLPAARARADRAAQIIREHHSIDHRARQLLNALARLD